MAKEIKELQRESELVTDKIMARLKKLENQNTANPIVVAKLYKPCCDGAVYLTDYVEDRDLITVYLLAKRAKDDDWVYSSRSTLQNYRCEDHGLPLQRDLAFTERHFADLSKEKRVHSHKAL